MKKYTALLGSAALAATLFTGCGESSDTETVADAPSTVKQYNATSLRSASNMLKRDQVTNSSEIAFSDVVLTLVKNTADETAAGNIVDAKQFIVDGLNASDAEEFNALSELEKETLITEAIASIVTGNNAPQRRSILDDLKDGIVDLIGTDLGTDVTVAAFKVVLESDGVTNVMLDMAINSQTITDVMITAMDNEQGWNDLTPKMSEMLRDPSNMAFAEKFMQLCYERPNMAEFVFTWIDAPMYDAVADAMIISSDAHVASGAGVTPDGSEHAEEYTTATMGRLMATYASRYFVIPTTSEIAQGDDSRFASLMFDSATAVRGDGNELINEKFFYALFKTPGSTESFIEAMKAIPNDKETYMDLFFTGVNPIEDAASAQDVNQSYNYIIAIAGGMYKGTTDYGVGAYTDSFLGFAGIVPTEKYWTYGKSFMMAGYAWGEMNGYSPLTGAFDLVSGWMSDDENTSAEAPALRGFVYNGENGLGDDDRNQTQWGGFAYDTVKTELVDRFANWDTAALAWDALYDYVLGDENSTVAADAYASLESNLTVASTNIQESFRSELELELNEDIRGFNELDNAGEDVAELALPAFADMNVTYIYTEVSDRTLSYIYAIDSKWISEMSENQYVQEYVYSQFGDMNDTKWEYIPNWMANLDWLKLPEIYTDSGYNDWGFDYTTGLFDIYIVTELADAEDRLLSDTGLVWTAAAEGDEPLSSDLDAEYSVYVTSVNLYELVNFDLDALMESISGYANGVAVKVGLADAPAEDTNTTTEG